MTIAVNADAASRLRAKLEPVLVQVSARSQLIADHHDPRGTYRRLVRLLHSEVRGPRSEVGGPSQRRCCE